MHVRNVHERLLPAPPAAVGRLLDTLASPDDALWPRDTWPPMRFDRPLGVGAAGGHGPIRYVVEAYEPGRSIVFRFTAPRGFVGTHMFTLTPATGGTVLRHDLVMDAVGTGRLSWAFVFRPLHDALLEDAFDRAEAALGGSPLQRSWPPRVRLLRWLARRGRRTRTGQSARR